MRRSPTGAIGITYTFTLEEGAKMHTPLLQHYQKPKIITREKSLYGIFAY